MNYKTGIWTIVLLAPLAIVCCAQQLDPARWSLTAQPAAAAPGSAIRATLTARIESGWHLYAPSTPPGGPTPTSISLAPNPAIAGVKFYQPKPRRAFDPSFRLDTDTYAGEAAFLADVRLRDDATTGPLELAATVRYQMCNDRLCLPPRTRTASAVITVRRGAVSLPLPPVPSGYGEIGAAAPPAAVARNGPAPVSGSRSAGGDPTSQGVAAFLLVAFGFGLAAIFTPCVFPMIPITVSYFLNREGGGRRSGGLAGALAFGLGIVALFTALGAIATAALGPFGVTLLGSNPWVNGFVAAVFLAFGASLLGAFEMAVPSGVLTRLDRASRGGGVAGPLLMGLTFSLAAFACVGPFVGTLLAAGIQAGGARPLLGMAAFAAGLASPFFLLALFPFALRKLPRSGDWLARVKVVMGFVILAAGLKYLSNVDQVMQWHALTRERFLAVWITLAALAGVYLLGLLRLEGARPEEKLGVARLAAGAAFLAFGLSLIPGMAGGRLGELDAYVPAPLEDAWRRQVDGGDAGPRWMTNQYREALAQARGENRLALVSFSGYACSNCHWMKANMFPRAEIAAALKEFVLVELYTDGADAASQENQRLEQSLFGTVAIPYYAVLNADGKALATFAGLTRQPQEFLAFLKTPAGGTPR